MSDQTHVITDLPEVPVTTVLKHYARKATKLALIGGAVVGTVVLVQRFRATEDQTGGAESVV